MIPGRITRAMANWKRLAEARLPAPMAAPETPRLKRWRMTLIVQLVLIGILTAMWGPLAASKAHEIAVVAWLALALASLGLGPVWLVAKLRADHTWANREREE